MKGTRRGAFHIDRALPPRLQAEADRIWPAFHRVRNRRRVRSTIYKDNKPGRPLDLAADPAGEDEEVLASPSAFG
jgi:hypothetical protein